MPTVSSGLTFTSDDPVLCAGFAWAKSQALAYAFRGDPVGDWYEAALPGRAAFCMRDVSHQATGAHLLGLASANLNMLRRFAASIAIQRDWCCYWEIDKRGLPCPVDYRDDQYFWYNFPANFDVLDCCLRQYLWSGDRAYLDDPALRFFYAKSVDEFVRAWDHDGDGLLEHYPSYGFRGIASYEEGIPDLWLGGDLLAAQAAGYRAYASILELEERQPDASVFIAKARAIQDQLDGPWWDEEQGCLYAYRDQAHAFVSDSHASATQTALYFGTIQDEPRLKRALDNLERMEGTMGVEGRSYTPEILYRYQRIPAAYRSLQSLFDPGLPRREYPELSYALIGALGTGMLGLQPDARERVVATLPRLAPQTAWAEMSGIPVFETGITLRHEGLSETRLTARPGRPFYWRAAFPGSFDTLQVDGRAWPAAQEQKPGGQIVSSVLLRVAGGESHTVKHR